MPRRKQILGAAILGTGGDEAIHGILDAMNAKAPYTTPLGRAHPPDRVGTDPDVVARPAAGISRLMSLALTGDPRFANARSVRNAIDRMRLRQANRLVAAGALVGKDNLVRLEPADITVSRVFGTGP